MARVRRIGMAVVGLGGIARRAVLPAFRHSKRARLAALVSSNQAKAARLAKEFGAPQVYSNGDYQQCLSNPAVEAVYLASPNGCHMQQTIDAAAAGKHILCEKPMANTVQDCAAMIAACRQRVRLMIAYRKYFEPGSIALKKLIKTGKLGRLRLMQSAFTIMFPPGKAGGWRFDPSLAGGGALPDLGIYCINTARWLAGADPLEAEAHSWITDPARFSEAIDEHVAFRLNFPEGLVLQACASFGAAQASYLHVNGERGWAALDPAFAWDEERRLFGKAGGGRKGQWFERKFPVIDEFALEIDAFASCVIDGREPEPGGIDGLRDVAAIEAIYRAARERRTVPVVIPAI
ncbi:MAG: Gfo/Idh/MocA family oxidoreductase [Acidobacteriota bacterium]|nr:Gfo/Idh/MocA family oxidoreductase [Acidobacteriota bacterium]